MKKPFRLPRLGRGGKIFRNLLLSGVLLFLFWWAFGCPLPTAEGTFRRLERQNLFPASEILYVWENPRPARETGSEPRVLVLGEQGDQFTLGHLFRRRRSNPGEDFLELWPREEGPSPIPLSHPIHGEDHEDYSVLLFAQIPEEAASAAVTLTNRLDHMKNPVETAQGERTEGGLWVFRFPIGLDLVTSEILRYGGRDLEGLPYTLVLYRADGSVLEEQSGRLPESGLSDSYHSTYLSPLLHVPELRGQGS